MEYTSRLIGEGRARFDGKVKITKEYLVEIKLDGRKYVDILVVDSPETLEKLIRDRIERLKG